MINHTFEELYAVPAEGCIIDTIVAKTGLTSIYSRTEADVLARAPRAVRMTWDTWQADQVVRQHTPITWAETTGAQYDEMLNVLPPAFWRSGAFLVGEPVDHDFATGQPRFDAYWQRYKHFYVASRPVTIAEMRHELEDGSMTIL
jgi:hypothetical protein